MIAHRSRRRIVRIAAALLMGVLPGAADSAASEIPTTPYHLTRLGAFQGSRLNNLGQVIGTMPTADPTDFGAYAAIYHSYGERAGAVDVLPGTGNDRWSGRLLNDRGQSVVQNNNAGFDPSATWMLFHDGTEARPIEADGRAGYFFSTEAMNNAGTVVGSSSSAPGEIRVGLWSDGRFRPLAAASSFGHAAPSAINDLGQVVGSATTFGPHSTKWHAVLWQDGTEIDLGTLGGDYAGARDINNAGQVVGTAMGSDGEPHAFLWQDGTMEALDVPGLRFTDAIAINSAGHILGVGWDADGNNVPFLYADGESLIGNQFLPAGLDPEAVMFTDFNDLGQILGFEAVGWDYESFLLTPATLDAPAPIGSTPANIPEPTTLATLGVLGIALLVRRRRAGASPR